MHHTNEINVRSFRSTLLGAGLALLVGLASSCSDGDSPRAADQTTTTVVATTSPEPVSTEAPVITSTPTPAATEPPATVPATPTTSAVPASTVPASTVPDTLPPGEIGFAPECVDSTRTDKPSTQLDESELEAFGPLQIDPAISFQLPNSIGPADATIGAPPPQPLPATASVVRVPGGFLFAIISSSNVVSADGLLGLVDLGTILKVVDDDGAVRWQRCIEGTVHGVDVAPAGLAPTEAIVPVTAQGNAFSALDFRIVDLATGEFNGSLSDRVAAQGIDPQDDFADVLPLDRPSTHLLFGPSRQRPLAPATDQLISLGLATMHATAFPLAPSAAGGLAWNMLDLHTGKPVAGQRWADPAFKQPLAGDEFVSVTNFGATVAAINGRQVNVYYPTQR